MATPVAPKLQITEPPLRMGRSLTLPNIGVDPVRARGILPACGLDPHNKLVVRVLYGLDPQNNVTTE